MKSDPRDYKVEISSVQNTDQNKPSQYESRPFLSVMFNCCKVYQRVYRNIDGSCYEGRCPKCLRTIKFVVGKEGSNDRFFVVE